MKGRSISKGAICAVGGGVAAAAACWWLTATMAADFADAAPGRIAEWWGASFAVLFAMWAAMMAAMMAPAAAPFLRLFWRCRAHLGGDSPAATAAAAGGYLSAWMLFSAAAAALHSGANSAAMLGDGMSLHSPEIRAMLFAAAGAYQLTPFKFACLRGCRPPPLMLILDWRPGIGGAFALGAKNGMYCVGCCWALMLLLFAGGVMDLRWIAALTLYALAEKAFPSPRILARATGFGLLFFAAAELVS
ncbi:MAG: DUF2182 domain-containing protein [Gammaproteobacteria bacterium]